MNIENPTRILNGRNELGAGEGFPLPGAYMRLTGRLTAGATCTVVIEEADAKAGPYTAMGVTFNLDTVGQRLESGWVAFTKRYARANVTARSLDAVVEITLGVG